MLRTVLLASAMATAFLLSAQDPALAEGTITVTDPYARASTKMSQSGAAFMVIANSGTEADQLIEARADVADRVELHTHKEDGDGVMRMIEVEEGFTIPAGGEHALARGGDHVMFLGLGESLEQGQIIPVTLVFEKAGEISIEVPVDLTRAPKGHGGGMMKKAAPTN